MKNKNLLRKTLVVRIITLFISTSLIGTSLVLGDINNPIQEKEQEKESQYLENETYTPYLEIVLANETKTFSPTDDTYIANLDPSEINGDLDYLATRNRYGAGDVWECDILIQFDISSIPPSTPVISASLNLYYYSWGDSNPKGRPLTVYRITSDWDEMTVNFNAKPSSEPNVSASEVVPGSVDVWMTWDLTDDVQQCVNDPGSSFGWEIMDETYWGTYWVPAAYFYPKEYIYNPPVPPFIPYLEVELADETKTFSPTDDTYIANLDPSEINGDLDYLATRNRYGAGDVWECDILIQFDISSIPPSTPVISASLNLYYYSWGDSNPKGRPLTVYRITSDWDEARVNYNRRPSMAATVSASEKIPSNEGVRMSWDLTDDVQQYVNNPEINFGWEIMDENHWGDFNVPAAYFYPKEFGASSFVPSFIFGRITNKVVEGNVITFEAVKTRVIYFSPVTFYTYSSNEKITIEKGHIDWFGGRFIFALCKVSPIY